MYPHWYQNIRVNNKLFNFNNTINAIIPSVKNKIAILVGAAPSLNKHLNLLNEISKNKKYVLIGCDAVYPKIHYLDFYITAEEEILSSLFFRDTGFKHPKIVASSTCNPFPLHLVNKGNNIYFYNNGNNIMMIRERFSTGMLPDIPALNSYCNNIIGHAISLAEYCMAKEIILIGTDFFVEGKQTHFNKSHPIQNDKNLVNTSFERHINELKENVKKLSIPITNCSESGKLNFLPMVKFEDKIKNT